MGEDPRDHAGFGDGGNPPECAFSNFCISTANSTGLPATIGWAATAHLFYTASWLDAKTCLEIGLVWKTCAAERLLDRALEVASEIARMPVSSLVETKRLLLAARPVAQPNLP